MENYSVSGFPDIYRSGLGVKERAIRPSAPIGGSKGTGVSDARPFGPISFIFMAK